MRKPRVLILQTALAGNKGTLMSTDPRNPHLHKVRLDDGRSYWFADADMERL